MDLSSRRRDFKKTIDVDETRRRREENDHLVRKSEKAALIAKKRQNQGAHVPATSSTDLGLAEQSEEMESSSMEFREASIRELGKVIGQAGDGEEFGLLEAVVEVRRRLSLTEEPPIKEILEAGK